MWRNSRPGLFVLVFELCIIGRIVPIYRISDAKMLITSTIHALALEDTELCDVYLKLMPLREPKSR